MFREAYIETIESEEQLTTKEISISFIKNKDQEHPHCVLVQDC